MRIKTGDQVKIVAGAEKGKTGKVSQVFPSLNKVVVEGLNMTTKHLRARGEKNPGKKIEYAAPMHVSNVALVTKDGTVGRVGVTITKKDEKTTKRRVLRTKGREVALE
ncbi:50S ribosomal protein L24 [Candidatus Uhrbacteria bacterium]|nr:50S ribosomal protein L24 [Candidatus Uhrbacteria bacterium]